MNIELKKYTKMGIVATAVVVVALIGVFVVSSMRSESNLATALEKVSTQTAKASDLSIAVINMDKIQLDSKALQDLRKQRTSYEEKLKNRLEKEQKAIEKEKADIEEMPNINKLNKVKVSTFSELIDLYNEIRLPINYYEEQNKSIFFIINNQIIWIYILKQDEV